jgi:hypothetical protein
MLLAAILVLAPTMCLAQPLGAPGGVDLSAAARASESAATKSLSTLSALAENGEPQRLGFRVPGDAAHSELAPPMSDFLVGLDSLRSWRPGGDPMALLRYTNLIVYPVTVGGEVQSSITLKKEDDGWRAVEFGAPALSVATAATRAKVAGAAPGAASDMFRVRIPAFNLVFIGYRQDGRLMLSPVADAPQYGLSSGAPIAADQLFTQLQPEAERDQGLPR